MQSLNTKEHKRLSKAPINEPTLRRCSVCDSIFIPSGHWERFCADCNTTHEVLEFARWMPEESTGFLPFDVPQA